MNAAGEGSATLYAGESGPARGVRVRMVSTWRERLPDSSIGKVRELVYRISANAVATRAAPDSDGQFVIEVAFTERPLTSITEETEP